MRKIKLEKSDSSSAGFLDADEKSDQVAPKPPWKTTELVTHRSIAGENTLGFTPHSVGRILKDLGPSDDLLEEQLAQW